ncbi:MAG: ABC transporter permease subunit [Bdellovibrionaceae bacterium]|nr:ABC transporter permease subunit [Pseudobdellovibrionaceae bacterium]MDW8189742.1 ABC transporter permease subunit [Pseudobdellovibrionaceae bacterium]
MANKHGVVPYQNYMNPSQKRWLKFKRNKPALISLYLLSIMLFFSLTAEIWSSSRPIILKYNNQWYFPALVTYHPTVFGREDIFVMDYRSLELKENDWAIWPINQWDPYESNKSVEYYPSPPSAQNWLGTDDRGRDILSRLLYGFRYTMAYAIGVWLLSYLIGTVVGAALGYFGGKLDLWGSRVVEIIETMPVALLLITVISIFSPNVFGLIFFTVVFEWTGIFHHMRAQFLQLRKREFVEASTALGLSHSRIIFRHILPNALTPLVTFSPFNIAANIYLLATLDFLGLGLPAPTPSLGELISQAKKYVTSAEWLVWSPAITIVITMTAFINIGIAIRDAYDARM